MSVVVWDTTSLVTDRRCTNAHISTLSKSKLLEDGTVVAWVGTQAQGLALCAWYEAGARIETYPKFQETDEWSILIVANKIGCKFYEKLPYPIEVEDTFFAWGSGSAYALAALHLNCTASEAVELAIKLDPECGNGLTIYVFKE
jgi:ATP-dependent protease HslVU (ClpYQ) peptidase subunit